VILYDRLVIPVPPDPQRAQSAEDRGFAEKQWARWEEEGWQPERLHNLLAILRPVVEPIEWDRQHHEVWAREFANYAKTTPAEAADLVGRMMAGWVTGQVLLGDLPAKAAGAVAVAPFTSLGQLTADLGITETHALPERMKASQGLPANLVSAVVGREFLVPTDPEWDEFDLLREAVDLVRSEDYRSARKAFHGQMLGFVRDELTDYDSVKGAATAMERELQELDRLARKRKRWRRADRAFFFSQVALDVATAPVNPLGPARAGVAIGAYTTSQQLGEPASPHANGPAGALLHDAQRQLRLAPSGERAEQSALQRLAEAVFGRRRRQGSIAALSTDK
jgi:hypothetical protein